MGLAFVLKRPVTWWFRRHYRGAMSEVIPPENVRIQLADGTVLPVELIYTGLDERGLHEWVAVSSFPVDDVGARVLADKVPPRTSITIMVRPKD